jgi:hypothetical protein
MRTHVIRIHIAVLTVDRWNRSFTAEATTKGHHFESRRSSRAEAIQSIKDQIRDVLQHVREHPEAGF